MIRALKLLGPGLITGASDDDPSGIATYSQAGAQFGYKTLWSALLTFPLMAAMQGICARIGIVTGKGLTVTLKEHYPKWVLYGVLMFSVPAITLNIGADIQGMGAVAHLVIPQVPAFSFSIIFTALLMFVIVKYKYRTIANVLKWLCLSLLLYLVAPFMVKQDWGNVFRNTVIPSMAFNKESLSIIVAILGTTISPYLFFWQATMEAEDRKHGGKVLVNKRVLDNMKADVNVGMLLSNVVMFFIILTTGSVLFNAGTKINTIEDAARALQPLTGHYTYLVFSLGVMGTGLLAIPVLAGSQSYMLSETFGWKTGLDKPFTRAKGFYISIIIPLIVGLCLDLVGVSAVKALIYTAILYGLTCPFLIAVVIHIGNNKKIMGDYTSSKLSNILAVVTLAAMTAAAICLLYFQFQ
jgi:NRAMP (natural resistance-associated macrophage protein)-like metal ion transporter